MPIPDQRLHNQRISRPRGRDPARIVAWLGAVQAQEYGPAKWALGLRMSPGMTDKALDRALDRGAILRTHVLRPTWHFVTPADIRWMLELTAPLVHRRMSTYDRQLGLDTAVMTRAAGIFERALGDHGCLTRRELGTHLQRAGLPSRSMELGHIAMYAELEGLICSGPRRGTQSTYALLEHLAPGAPRLSREEALAELAERFFRSHGPATVRDFVWWSGIGTPDAKRALEMIRARPQEVGGIRYWTVGRSLQPGARRKPAVDLLPIYDEYLVAYRDRQVVPHALYANSLVSFRHALVVDGQVAGTWRTGLTPRGMVLDVESPRALTGSEKRGLSRAVERYRRFLGVPVKLTVGRKG
ncbi:MAG TPA: winged helix DNA-binding domain-containing protein [Gemmatimonadales bacterium]|nr:winged helix DNA-binding domain-containing protein [Gemmatimonadales bacterium]